MVLARRCLRKSVQFLLLLLLLPTTHNLATILISDSDDESQERTVQGSHLIRRAASSQRKRGLLVGKEGVPQWTLNAFNGRVEGILILTLGSCLHQLKHSASNAFFNHIFESYFFQRAALLSRGVSAGLLTSRPEESPCFLLCDASHLWVPFRLLR